MSPFASRDKPEASGRVTRWPGNPIITPFDVAPSRPDMEIVGTFNAGVARRGDEVLLLLRVAERPINPDSSAVIAPVFDPKRGTVEHVTFRKSDGGIDVSDSRVIVTPSGTWLTSLSHLRLARSRDRTAFTVDPSPTLFPANEYEAFGIEDCRITEVAGEYLITYSAVSAVGITAHLATTRDFATFERRGNVFHPDNKDVAIFPERVGDRYFALHRPASAFGRCADVWIAQSPDLVCWGAHRHLFSRRADYWDEAKVGGGCVPFLTDEGWIALYHGVGLNDVYSVGAVLLDAREPWKLLARSKEPVMTPEADYETQGFWGSVVFPCGCLVDGRTVTLYYGAADRVTCMAELSLDGIFDTLA